MERYIFVCSLFLMTMNTVTWGNEAKCAFNNICNVLEEDFFVYKFIAEESIMAAISEL